MGARESVQAARAFDAMKAVCASCLKEGKPEEAALIGEKEPLEDERETHGICGTHRQEIEALRKKVDP